MAGTLLAASGAATETALRFEVSLRPSLLSAPQDGRLFVILAHSDSPEPRTAITRASEDAPFSFARDVSGFSSNSPVVLDQASFAFPLAGLSSLPPGDYWVQALFDFNRDIRLPNAPNNLYSQPKKLHLDPATSGLVKLELSRQLPPDTLPADTAQNKFIKIQSRLLSDFYHRPIYLRAGVILPKDYEREPSRRYPLWVRIGGFGTRYTAVTRLAANPEFSSTWRADDTPRLILLQVDGAGPLGDPYQVNSDNHGPFGDALTQELIPYIETHFRALGSPRARFVTGTSTGGWVCLALQIFYPDFFNGAWSSCPDPVDFHALQLVDIYSETNAYVNPYGNERPSERARTGDVALTMRRETGMENLIARGNSYVLSGEQWGAWNATYSPRGANGLPLPIWDPQTGAIDRAVAEHWKKYDLHLVLAQNWKTLGPKLRGKIHIAAGENDQYFLNNAVHLLDDFLSKADPPFEGKIVYGPGKRHGWMDLTMRQVLEEMDAATRRAP
jgi:S-formylglutathione hydrolase FrmB